MTKSARNGRFFCAFTDFIFNEVCTYDDLAVSCSMKLVSWNVNGVRAVIRKNVFFEFIEKYDPDVISLQEVKAERDQVDLSPLGNYQVIWNSAQKRGYSGTAILTKVSPAKIQKGLGIEKHDKEGRVITLEFDSFWLVNVYTPNSKRGLSRLPYRQEWDRDMLAYLCKLEGSKPVVLCGDLNVAYQPIDLSYPNSNERSPGYTAEERFGFYKLCGLENPDSKFLDSFREFDKRPFQYTWWSYVNNARAKNIGWRLDYFCVSKRLKSKLVSASILQEVMGSDHCPVSIELKE